MNKDIESALGDVFDKLVSVRTLKESNQQKETEELNALIDLCQEFQRQLYLYRHDTYLDYIDIRKSRDFCMICSIVSIILNIVLGAGLIHALMF